MRSILGIFSLVPRLDFFPQVPGYKVRVVTKKKSPVTTPRLRPRLLTSTQIDYYVSLLPQHEYLDVSSEPVPVLRVSWSGTAHLCHCGTTVICCIPFSRNHTRPLGVPWASLGRPPGIGWGSAQCAGSVWFKMVLWGNIEDPVPKTNENI